MNSRTLRRAAERQTLKLEQQKLKAIAQGQSFQSTNDPHIPEVPMHRATGPTTPAGKFISSQNALKHGACALSQLILETESIEDFKALEARWFETYNVDPNSPSTAFEADLIRTAIRADWLAQRAESQYIALESELFTHISATVWDFTENQYKALALAQRYRTANANALTKARKAIEDHRKNRRLETTQLQRQAITEIRLETLKQKQKQNHPSPEPPPTESQPQRIKIVLHHPDAIITDQR